MYASSSVTKSLYSSKCGCCSSLSIVTSFSTSLLLFLRGHITFTALTFWPPPFSRHLKTTPNFPLKQMGIEYQCVFVCMKEICTCVLQTTILNSLGMFCEAFVAFVNVIWHCHCRRWSYTPFGYSPTTIVFAHCWSLHSGVFYTVFTTLNKICNLSSCKWAGCIQYTATYSYSS